MSTQVEWIRERLPAEATFSKNGVTRTVEEAINSALADHAGETDDVAKRLALKDLLEIIRADILFTRERLGDWAGDEELLTQRINDLTEEAGETVAAGTFGSVPATYPGTLGSGPISDEFSND